MKFVQSQEDRLLRDLERLVEAIEYHLLRARDLLNQADAKRQELLDLRAGDER